MQTQKIKESDIQKVIKEYLLWNRWFVFKIHQSAISYKGTADLYAIKNGFSLWVEVKTATGKLSLDQQNFRDDILTHGGNYLLARSLEDVKEYLTLTEAQWK